MIFEGVVRTSSAVSVVSIGDVVLIVADSRHYLLVGGIHDARTRCGNGTVNRRRLALLTFTLWQRSPALKPL